MTFRSSIFIGLCSIAIACGGSVTNDQKSPTSPAPSSTAPSTSLADGGSSADGSVPAANRPRLCDPASATTCSPYDYCDYPVETCGGNQAAGTCKSRPTACEDVYAPVCGCNGRTYENACAASADGQSLRMNKSCEAFSCGDLLCDARSEFCWVSFQGEASCKPLPPSCQSAGKIPTCDCFNDEDASCHREMAGTAPAFTLNEDSP